MLKAKKMSFKEVKRVKTLPECQVDGKVSSMAYIDICSARIKLGGIHVTVYPIVDGNIKDPREVRQKEVLDSSVRQNVVSFAKSKKRKQKAKKKPLSARKYVPGRVSFMSA